MINYKIDLVLGKAFGFHISWNFGFQILILCFYINIDLKAKDGWFGFYNEWTTDFQEARWDERI